MTVEHVDRRVLGAVRFVSSVNGQPLAGSLRVGAAAPRNGAPVPAGGLPPVRVRVNSRGLHVIHTAPGLGDYTDLFDPAPTEPPDFDQEILLRVVDPEGRYLPREFAVPLPRPIDATRVDGEFAADSIFQPVDVALFPAATAPLADGWAVLRISVWREVQDPNDPLKVIRLPVPGALVRVQTPSPPASRLLGRGFTEWRRAEGTPATRPAEALVAIPGIPVTSWSDEPAGPVLTQAQSVRLEVRYDRHFVPGNGSDVAPPDMARLETSPGSIPSGVIWATLDEPLVLKARMRSSLTLILDTSDKLRRE